VAGDERESAPARRPVLHLSGFSVVRAVVMLGLAIALLAVIAASARVIGWLLVAVTLAGLLYPAAEILSRRVPRALALAVVVLVSLGIAVGVGYAVVDDLNRQLHELQSAVPSAAREIEQSDRFGKTAREIHLEERARAFVNELPQRLRGGNVQDEIRSAATRGVAFLATGVLTIFFLIHGPRLLRSGIAQLPAARQDVARRAGMAVYRRSWHYIAGSLTMAAMAGLVAYGCAQAIHVPGKAPLALWMMMLDPIPLLGVVLGALPLVLLAATTASWQGAVGVSIVLLGWQALEALVLQRRVEARSLHIGPFVTVSVVMVGLGLYGVGGATIGLVVVVLAAATLDELVGHGPRSSSPSVGSGE
jgi:predicted PurR-regulated permease PerM